MTSTLRRTGGAALLALAVTACGGTAAPTADSTAATTSTTATIAPATTTTAAAGVAAPTTSIDVADLVVTPSQTEGPYFPVSIPADHDNDLTVVAGASGTAAGKVIIINGTLLYADGTPVPDATVEIWQVDANGIYLHPNDPGVANRDQNFQGYGEAATDASGAFTFKTVYPGYYEGRALHIHMKVLVAGSEVLTTQLYFADDPTLSSDGIYQSVGASAAAMTLQPVETTLADGETVMVADHVVVLAGP